MNQDTEALILRYLAEGKTERVTVRDAITGNTGALQRIFHQLELHEQKDDARHAEMKASIAGCNARLDRLERSSEDTGKHNVELLTKQLDERKKSVAGWVQAMALALVSAMLGIVATLLTKGKS